MDADRSNHGDALQDATVLVTGGAGSVCRMLVDRLLGMDVDVVRIFDNNELSLADMKADVGNGRLRYLAGDIRDKPRLERAMQDTDIVVHATATKHVDIYGYNPFEAIQTNVMGLQNLIEASIDTGVLERVKFETAEIVP